MTGLAVDGAIKKDKDSQSRVHIW